MSTQEPTEKALEEFIAMPRGGVARRCQRRKKDGAQCSKPARVGFSICPSHGAGYPSREQSGERKRPGRPVSTGVYSVQPTRTFAETQAEVASLSDALTSSDRDLLTLKATLVFKLGELEAHAPKVEAMEAELERLVAEAATMDISSVGPEEAMDFVGRLANLRGPISKLDRLVSQVTDAAVKSITAHKARAETKAKLSEVEGVGYFLKLLRVQMRIVKSLSPDENAWETYRLALQREILGPHRLEAPPLELETAAA